ncbi:MAG: L-histidine N(alpha)-methyltransferase [Burkholderiaceae bacterium]|nr:L-histidine N(alpha)-methyltransferase [Burkholderiaceae bacterium]
MRSPTLLQTLQIDARQLAAEALAGLQQPAARVSPKFFYDALGSRLFDAITELDEYYLTRAEAQILSTHEAEIAAAARAACGDNRTLIDLGAGNCAKAARLFPVLQPRRYLALDISVDYLGEALGQLQQRHPDIEMAGLGLDFSARLALPAGWEDPRALIFYPGSSIGNFTPPEALRLLREARALAPAGALLIGVDLVKDQARLEAAYDDPLGVTAAFDLNLLRHLNRLAGCDFDLRDWRHVAFFDAANSRIEMHLEARRDLTLRWPGGARRFVAGERIHTENACKWTTEGFAALLHDAGWRRLQHWCDAAGDFAVFLAS